MRARPCGGCCPAAIPPSAAPPRRAAPVHAARTCPCGQGVAVARSSRLQGAYTAQDGIRRHRSSHCSECGLGHPAAPHGGCSSLPRTGFMSRGRASRCIYAGPVDAGKLTGAERGRVCRKHNIRNMSVIAHVDHGALTSRCGSLSPKMACGKSASYGVRSEGGVTPLGVCPPPRWPLSLRHSRHTRRVSRHIDAAPETPAPTRRSPLTS